MVATLLPWHPAGSNAGHRVGLGEERMRKVQFPQDPVTGKERVDRSGDLKRGWTEDIKLII